MDSKAFRHFYEYHFTINRKIWDSFVTKLSDDQFRQEVDYSYRSVRDQVLHLMGTDNAWFSDLSGGEYFGPYEAENFPDYDSIRAVWDRVEGQMRDYLAGLDEDVLNSRPLAGEDEDLLVWQVLLHVVNHGTDHRAQLLRMLHDLGVETSWQDYIFFCYGHPVP